jgi:hypothetical protein
MPSNISFYGEKLFLKEKESNLVTYQYKGSDKSLLYKYFYGKIAQIIVDNIIPEWVA